MVRKGCPNEVKFECRAKESAGVNLVDKWRKSILGRENHKYKGPEAEALKVLRWERKKRMNSRFLA